MFMFASCIESVRIMATHEHPFMGLYSVLITYALFAKRKRKPKPTINISPY